MDRLKARVYVAFGNLAIPSKRHVRMGRSLARQAFDTAQRAGDLTYAAFSCNFLLTELLQGNSLAEVQREAEAGLDRASGAVRSRGRAHHRTPPVGLGCSAG